MSQRLVFRTPAEARFAFRQGERAASARHTPGRNCILAALPAEDHERLLPDLELVPLPPGWPVHRAGEREKYLHFLTEGIVSRSYVMESGVTVDLGVTGTEGVIGIASFLGGEGTPLQATVLSAGHAYRLGTDLVQGEFERGGPLSRLLLRYTQGLMTQIGQIAVCNRLHSMEQQLCRWMLSCLDRLPSNELMFTQQRIAELLGARREGVTEAAGRLRDAGLIQYRRGNIIVLDRPRLEARACECYGVVRREFERLLRPPLRRAGVHAARRPADHAQARCFGR